MLDENSQKIDINDFVKKAHNLFKKELLGSMLESMNINISLTTSKTRFNGIRLWFKCPICKRRTGILYYNQTKTNLGCRLCMNIKYNKQRYKGMTESNIIKILQT